MGHETQVIDFNYSGNEKKDKEYIYKTLNSIAKRCGEYHSGIDHVCFENKTFENYKEAENYLYQHEGDYWQGCVKYKEYDHKETPKTTRLRKKLKLAKEKMESLREEFAEKVKKQSIRLHKSAYIGCPHCGSKVNKDFIRECYLKKVELATQKCPVCGEVLTSKSAQEQQQRWIENFHKVVDEYRKLEKEIEILERAKFTIKWLGKVEYHV